MCAGRIVVVGVTRQHMAQVPLPEHDDVVKALSSDRTYQTLRVAILPGRASRCRMITDAKRTKAANENFVVVGISVADQIARCVLPTAGFRELIGDPSAVGCAVTPSHKIFRRPWPMINSPYSNRNETVGTTNKSIAAMPSA